jgi:hypothetical protein
MITTPLITRGEIQQYKQLSNSINNNKLNELILQAQMVDLFPLLGEQLYYDVINNTANWSELLEGGLYEYNGITYTNVGLKAVLAHYTYARYSLFGDVIDTAFGLKEKLNSDVSKQVDYPMKKTLYEHNCNYAFNLWLNVENYIMRNNIATYIKCSNENKNKNFRISRIG